MSDLTASVSNVLSQASNAAASGTPKTGGKDPGAVAQDFEAMFLSQMIGPMYAGLDAEGEFDGGSAEISWRSLMINEYGKSIAMAGGVGIAAPVKAELIRMQGVKA